MADEQWICEALQNVLKNCVEYTNTNENIYVSAANTPLYVELTIKDTGVGISEQNLPHIFDRFYKGKNSKESRVGIGLTFAKAVITKQNATLKQKVNWVLVLLLWLNFTNNLGDSICKKLPVFV
ncbi:MAG: sensor histidine kinase [Oscillospiraceae bacterium]